VAIHVGSFTGAGGGGGSGDITDVTGTAPISVSNSSGPVPNVSIAVGSTAGTVAAGNDARLSDSRAPNGAASGDLGGTYPSPTVTQARGLREAGGTTLTMATVAAGEVLARVGTTVDGIAIGTGAGTIAAGDDSRLDLASTAVQPGSLVFGLAASMNPVAPNQSADAGALGDYTRIDHTHEMAALPGSTTELLYRANAGQFGAASLVEVLANRQALVVESAAPTPVASRIIPHAFQPTNMPPRLRLVPERTAFGEALELAAQHGTRKQLLVSAGASNALSTYLATLSSQGSGFTLSTPALSSASYAARQLRFNYATLGVAGNSAGWYHAISQFWRGNNQNLGGFWLQIRRLYFPVVVADQRVFVGLTASAAALGSALEPTAIDNSIGVGIRGNAGTSDTTLRIFRKDAAAAPTPIDLGANFPINATDDYDIDFVCPPNGTTIYYFVTNNRTGNTANGSFTTNLVASNTFLTPRVYVSNGASAVVAQAAMNSVRCEELGLA
jgi:hypothetical protein